MHMKKGYELPDKSQRGNTEGPDRPVDNTDYSGYAEVNPKQGLTGDDLMSAEIDGPESDYKGWNGVDDIPPSEYGDLLEK